MVLECVSSNILVSLSDLFQSLLLDFHLEFWKAATYPRTHLRQKETVSSRNDGCPGTPAAEKESKEVKDQHSTVNGNEDIILKTETKSMKINVFYSIKLRL